MNKRQIGFEYEEKARNYLMEQGYEMVTSNYTCRFGEIDIIAKQGNYLVFVEVKYRANERKGIPEEAVDIRKMKHITKTAIQYITTHGYDEFTPCRFDVVSITKEEIRLIQNAFEAVER